MSQVPKKHSIASVLPGSIAGELGIEPGDRLVSVNGEPVGDIFDYRYMTNEEYLTIEIEKADGEIWEVEIEKEFEEDLGMEFSQSLMDAYRSCSNRCIFCFIDQMPPGMRSTLYFKDDDSRLSFLQGNYVTLTNMSDKDLDRIIQYRMEPVNISFQAMNPELRCRMLRNRFAGESLKKARRLYEAGIRMNGQIVLCKGYNDGDELDRSIRELADYAPVLESLSVVPVGLTRFRDGLEPLEPFTREDARQVLSLIHDWQHRMLKRCGLHFVHASDEWYILAGEPLPPEENYDGYLQLENGVGMLRLQETEFYEALEQAVPDERQVRATIATGALAAPFLQRYMKDLQSRYPGVQAEVRSIRNDFFGEQITVSGLITGRDLTAQLSGTELGEKLLLPCNMLRDQEDVFLDDVTTGELSERLGVPVVIVEEGGAALLEAVLNPPAGNKRKRRQTYEQTGGGDRRAAECGQIDPV